MGKIYPSIFFLLVSLLLNEVIHAQTSCGTDDIHRRLLLNNPVYKKAIEQHNAKWRRYAKEKPTTAKRPSAPNEVYEIPVVIHVIHTGQAIGSVYNPTDETLYALIEELNQKFAATWPAYPGVGNGGVNVPIRFKLAQRTPDCQPTNGISRINGSSLQGYSEYGVDYGGNGFGASDEAVKALSIWPNTAYLNLWIVTDIQGATPGGSGIGGFATYPGTPTSRDGIVLRADQTSWSLTHETGHYLGLRHTFEGSSDATTCPPNVDCNNDGDLVCDTDPHSLIRDCPTGTNLCTGMSYEPVVYNTMGYTFCRNRFTSGQADRMGYMLENFRSSLLTSLGGLPPGPDPVIIPPPVAACAPNGNIGNDSYWFYPTTVKLAELLVNSNTRIEEGKRSYIDHTKGSCIQAQGVAHINSGEIYTITVITDNLNPKSVRGWIDFNNDGTFQSSELIISKGTSEDITHTATFAVPSTGVGTCTSLRMRISIDYADNSPSPQPCNNIQHGQTEDFIVIVQDQSLPATSVSIEANTGSQICEGTNVTFTATPVNGGNNPAYQWKLNDNTIGDNSNTYSTNTLANGDVISCVMTSSEQNSCSPTVTSNSITMSVNRTVIPTITISASQNNICSGTTVVFTATEYGGAYPSLQWKINGVNVQSNGYLKYTSSTLADGDVVSCVMTSAEPCANPRTVTSNSIVMKVATTLAPAVSIAINNGGPVCQGSIVSFTATPLNAGNNPAYQWKLNGTNVGENSSNYSNNSLSIGDAISCVITSSAQNNCNPTVTSNIIYVHFDQTVTPSVSISASETTICSGATVVFTATEYGGAYPSLQWKINGVDVQSNGYLKYTSSTLKEGDVVSCVMTSAEPCANPRTVTSNSIVMKVATTLAPTVSIAINSGGPVCQGSTVSFKATPLNAGNNPAYQWKLNGTNDGENSSNYSNNSLSIGDAISCVITSSAQNNCNPTVTSNIIYVHFDQTVTPSVSISASQTTICAGTNVTFIAYPVEGAEPTFRWKLNGNHVTANGNTYSNSYLADGDVVSCEMTSGHPCANPKTVTSNSITMSVRSAVTPSVSISASQNNICAGTNVTFTAFPIEGNEPDIQWKLNGNDVNRNSSSRYVYNTSTLADGDVVSCEMTSGHPCANPKTVTSNSIVMKVSTTLLPSININVSKNNICTGTSVTFTATAVYGGTNPKYQWKVGNTIVGSNPSYTTSSLKNGAVVTCTLTSNVGCANNTPVTSEGITMSVSSPPIASIVAGGATTFCSGKSVLLRTSTGSGYTYQWKKAGVDIPGATSSSHMADAAGIYTVVVTNAAGCTTTSEGMSVIVNPVPLANVVASGPLTFCSGKSVTLRTSTVAGYTYQWKRGGANIDGATQSSHIAIASGLYTVVVTNTSGCSTTSAATNVVVNALPLATITPNGPLTFCAGKNVLLRANTGTNYTYQWKRGGINIPGETTLYYTATTTGLYNVVVTNAVGCAVTSPPVTVVVNPLPVATISPAGPTTFCNGKNVLLRANTGTNYTYQWKKAGAIIAGETASNYTATATGVYTVVVTNSYGCSVTSAPVTVTVNSLPLATVAAAGATTFCAGKDVLLKAITGAGYSYQWKKNGANITGETNSTYKATTTGAYTVVVTNAAGCSATSTAINVTVNTAPLASVAIGGPTTFCAGKNVLLKAIVGTGYTYQWRRSGANIHNATSSNYYADATGVYTVVVTNAGGCSTTSAGINVTVNAAPPATITYDGPLTFPQGGSVVLKAPAGTGYTYQWKGDGANINNATGENYTATLSGSYTVVITNSNTCQATSQPVLVSVASERLITKGLDSEDDLIKVYPNPLYRSEYLNIEWSQINAENGLQVLVSDITGRLIEKRKLNQYDRKIPIKGASGIYIVEVRWGVNQRKVFRVIKIE